ncbi:MAG: hypothetical protein KGK08_08285 [Acidobacteriota bacterium]|nr:hypothetical protein [Acidobacteriota bacterium]
MFPRQRHALRLVLPLLLVVVLAGTAVARHDDMADPNPEPAIPALLAAFEDVPVVAIGEAHGLQQAGDFYVALVQAPGFADHVNDIVVEWSTPRYQSVLDRYVNGEDVPPTELAEVFRNTTKVFAWESPIYPRLLQAVRELNRSLPAEKRVRVLGGDAPIDWSQVKNYRQWNHFQPNNKAFADVITTQVLDRHRHALVILGSNHLTRGGDRWGSADVTTMLEKRYPHATRVVLLASSWSFGMDPDLMHNWPVPSLAATSGKWASRISFDRGSLKDSGDAVLYLGQDLNEAQPDWKSLTPAYLREIDRRSRIEWGCPFDVNRWRRNLGPCG